MGFLKKDKKERILYFTRRLRDSILKIEALFNINQWRTTYHLMTKTFLTITSSMSLCSTLLISLDPIVLKLLSICLFFLLYKTALLKAPLLIDSIPVAIFSKLFCSF
jgi:hypothetical protein